MDNPKPVSPGLYRLTLAEAAVACVFSLLVAILLVSTLMTVRVSSPLNLPELDAMRARHRLGIGLYESMGGFSPVFGILGTVEAMIAILGNLSNPDKLGPEIALAMVATLYGVAFANLLFLPVASRLKKLSEDELRIRQMTIDILVNIQEGAKFEFIRERMRLSLPPATRRTIAALSERKRNRARRAEVEAPQPVAAPEEPMDAYPHDENHGQDGYDDDEMY
jgi:flagellar motor component MotA